MRIFFIKIHYSLCIRLVVGKEKKAVHSRPINKAVDEFLIRNEFNCAHMLQAGRLNSGQ